MVSKPKKTNENQDPTDSNLKDQENSLLFNNKFSEVLFNQIPLGIARYDDSGDLVDFNPEAHRIFGIGTEEYKHKINVLVDPYFPEELKQKLKNHVNFRLQFELNPHQIINFFGVKGNINKNITIDLGMISLFDQDGEFNGYLAVFDDITNRLANDLKYLEQEKMFHLIFSQSMLGKQIYDLSGSVVDFNQAVLDLFGIPENLKNKLINIFEDPNISEEIRQKALSGDTFQFELEYDFEQIKRRRLYPTNKTNKLWLNITINPIYGKDNNLELYLVQFQDISEHKKMLEYAKTQYLNRLSLGLANDFNNILASISGNLELIQEDLIDSENTPKKVRDRFQKIQFSIDRASTLTKSLVSFSGEGKYNPKDIDINLTIMESINLLQKGLASTKNFIIQGVLNSGDIINADEAQLYQIIQNLVINAWDAMPNGGIVTISTDDIHINEITGQFDIIPEGQYVRLRIKDSGKGIEPSIMEQLFQPFVTNKKQAIGLGLSIVYKIVKNHNAFVDVATIEGEGSTFDIYFPIIAEESNQKANPSMGNKKIETILIVDDEKSILEILEMYLKKSNYRVFKASNGVEALNIFQENSIDMIISDLIMQPMDGNELFYNVRRINPELPFLIMSGYYKDEKVQEMLESGAKGFITKPFKFKEIERLIKESELK